MNNPILNSDSFSNLLKSLFFTNTRIRILWRLCFSLFVLNLGFSQNVIAKPLIPLVCDKPPRDHPVHKYPDKFVCMINEKGQKIHAAGDLTYPVQNGIDDSGLKAPVAPQPSDTIK
jgi:hypothetical protein